MQTDSVLRGLYRNHVLLLLTYYISHALFALFYDKRLLKGNWNIWQFLTIWIIKIWYITTFIS